MSSMSSMSSTVPTISVEQRWVAFGPAGAVGTILRDGGDYVVRVLRDASERGPFPSLDIAKRALHAAMGPGSERPDFREH